MAGNYNYNGFSRGSEWRKWDLHIHSPFSALNNGFGSDFDLYAKTLFLTAIEKGIHAIGITDYFSITGYKKIREMLLDEKKLEALFAEKAELVKKIRVFANIEFRSSVLVKQNRVNFHVIFSDDVDPKDIEEKFLEDIKISIEGNPGQKDEKWSLKASTLESLGKKLKAEHQPFQDKTDLFVGMMNAVVEHNEVTDILENRSSVFSGKYLFCLPPDEDLSDINWDSQGHLIRKMFIQKAHFFFSTNEKTKNWALGKKHVSPEQFQSEYKSLKPCLGGSDAHKFTELFEPAQNRFTWIKADVTFEGLKQVINEPADRVFIGETPPAVLRVRNNSTKVISKLKIIKEDASDTKGEIWFNSEVPLNSELVAIIGNKGSGKSALADIIGFLGNTPHYKSFSFLSSKKFRDPKNNKAKWFQAGLTWMDGSAEGPKNLDLDPDTRLTEKVQYIPQNYLESICNEVGLANESPFYKELEKVIFSHVPLEETIGKDNLSEILVHKGEEAEKAIEALVLELKEINKKIVGFETEGQKDFLKSLQDQLTEKERELTAHTNSKPALVKKPEEDDEVKQKNDGFVKLLDQEKNKLKVLEEEIQSCRNILADKVAKIAVADKIIGKVDNISRNIGLFKSEAESDAKSLGIDFGTIFTFTLNKKPIEEFIEAETKIITDAKHKLNADKEGSLTHSKNTLLTKIANIQENLTGAERSYHAYLENHKKWESTKFAIIGNEDTLNSIEYFKKQILRLKDLPERLDKAKEDRRQKVKEIFDEKKKLREQYSKYYNYAQAYIDKHELAVQEQFELTFNAAITQEGLPQRFLQMIDGRKSGPFSKGAGNEILKSLLDGANFNTFGDAWAFLENLISKMTVSGLQIKDQILQSFSVEEFYDLIYSLQFLRPAYNLQWGGKELEKLSPGERGNLLLIFYLLMDKSDIPLVIDQPEENLDNQTVFKTLVPCIKDAKKRRQIILVTHNPNLAVVCDADQVIYAEIEKEKNKVTYLSGAIENPLINKSIIDVLEGTRPAFDIRDSKYQSVLYLAA